MGSVGNGPIRTHLILMGNSNVSGLLGLGKGFYSLSDFGWMFCLGLKEVVQTLLQTHRGELLGQHSSPRFAGQLQTDSLIDVTHHRHGGARKQSAILGFSGFSLL